jgi:hypothetical protein
MKFSSFGASKKRTVKSEQARWGVEGGSQKVVLDEKPSQPEDY